MLEKTHEGISMASNPTFGSVRFQSGAWAPITHVIRADHTDEDGNHRTVDIDKYEEGVLIHTECRRPTDPDPVAYTMILSNSMLALLLTALDAAEDVGTVLDIEALHAILKSPAWLGFGGFAPEELPQGAAVVRPF